MKIKSNIQIGNFRNQPFLLDHYDTQVEGAPLLIFCHGIKGFKDWGHWGLLGQYFLEEGFNFIKFNYANNGTTVDQPLEIIDLEGFKNNDYIKELDDLEAVINWGKDKHEGSPIFLIGHSRSGPIVLIKGMENECVSGAITWAGVLGLDYSWKGKNILFDWEREGHYEIKNSRTGQTLQVAYSLYETFEEHKSRLEFSENLNQTDLPILFIHGTEDPAVPHSAAESLHEQCKHSELVLIEGADHVFDGSHPWAEKELPLASQTLAKETSSFIKRVANI